MPVNCLSCVAEPPEWEDFDDDDDVVDLRAYAVLGGVFHFNLLHLPPQPRVINSWTITQGESPSQPNAIAGH